MLPPKDMHRRCLRCGAELAEVQRMCPDCGADREVEMAVAAELDPVIATLRRWLVLVGALLVLYALLIYQKIGYMPLALQLQIVAGVVLAQLALIARKAPLPVAGVAMILFLGGWGYEISLDPWASFHPGFGLAVRAISFAILLDALRGGLKARAIRRRVAEQVPRAVARVKE
jgi:hypothetical protein